MKFFKGCLSLDTPRQPLYAKASHVMGTPPLISISDYDAVQAAEVTGSTLVELGSMAILADSEGTRASGTPQEGIRSHSHNVGTLKFSTEPATETYKPQAITHVRRTPPASLILADSKSDRDGDETMENTRGIMPEGFTALRSQEDSGARLSAISAAPSSLSSLTYLTGVSLKVDEAEEGAGDEHEMDNVEEDDEVMLLMEPNEDSI